MLKTILVTRVETPQGPGLLCETSGLLADATYLLPDVATYLATPVSIYEHAAAAYIDGRAMSGHLLEVETPPNCGQSSRLFVVIPRPRLEAL